MISKADLNDLYIGGVDFQIDKPDEADLPEEERTPFLLHFEKLRPSKQMLAGKKANAARIRLKARLLDKESEEYVILKEELEALGDREVLRIFLTEIEVARRQVVIEQELSEEDEWLDDDKLQGLLDAWDAHTQMDYAKGPGKRKPETEALFAQIKKFNDVLADKLDKQRVGLLKEFDLMTDDELEEKAMYHLIERETGMEWARVFKEYQMLYGVLDRGTMSRIYSDIEEISDVPTPIYRIYLQKINELAIAPTELKS